MGPVSGSMKYRAKVRSTASAAAGAGASRLIFKAVAATCESSNLSLASTGLC